LERKQTIKEKDNRIFELKKKTQELEKFKFVLDYKIKELKRDIGPREIQIQDLNEQTNKMRSELKHFNRVN
jgi:cilia- and flagella-associated protein 57